MSKLLALLAASAAAVIARDHLLPLDDGTAWTYNLTEEAGHEFTFAPGIAGADGKIHRVVIYRLDGMQQLNGKSLLKFEMHRDDTITNTDLLTVNDHGVFCAARINEYGELTALQPPQTIVAAPLRVGASWDYNGRLANVEVHQRYRVVGEEDVDVAAGKFHAFHIRCEQTRPIATTVDRWFVNGVGIVKDITETRAADGDLVRRITLELKEQPKIAPRPVVKPLPPPKQVTVSFSTPTNPASVKTVRTAATQIYARWQARGVRVGAKIRAVWVAENVPGFAPPDYKIDEATAAANSSNSHGVFTLSRPNDGWAPGQYRVDIYVDTDLIDSAKLTIAD